MEQKVICGDCLEILKLMSEKSFDVIVTSPPYNISKDYKTYKDNLPRDAYLSWSYQWLTEIKRVMKDDGSLFLNIGFINKDPWIGMDVANEARKIFILQNNMVWIKSIFVDGRTYGHFKPCQGDRFITNTFEHIFHFTKEGGVKVDRLAVGVPYTNKYNAKDKEDLRCRGNCWFIPYESIKREAEMGVAEADMGNQSWMTVKEAAEKAQVPLPIVTVAVNDGTLKGNGKVQKERRIDAHDLARWMKDRLAPKNNADHPAIFPWTLPEMCIKLHGVLENMLVLDPFLGWGNTLIACKRLGVNGIGIEIDPDYAKEAEKQLSTYIYKEISEEIK